MNNFRGISVLDPEPKDMYHCHPYHFSDIYKPPVNEPIGSYQIQHLKIAQSEGGTLGTLLYTKMHRKEEFSITFLKNRLIFLLYPRVNPK